MKWLALVILLIIVAVRTELYPIIMILYMLLFGCFALFFWIRGKFKDK